MVCAAVGVGEAMSPTVERLFAIVGLFAVAVSIGAALATHHFDGLVYRVAWTVALACFLLPSLFRRDRGRS